MNQATSKIGATIQKYTELGAGSIIPHRKNPGVTFGVYTEYESDVRGAYTYFIGEEVHSLDVVPEGYVSLVIPAQNYTKFTTPTGAMPQVCVDAWIKIWSMNEVMLGGRRSFVADFELYDERARNPARTELDIFIGIDKK